LESTINVTKGSIILADNTTMIVRQSLVQLGDPLNNTGIQPTNNEIQYNRTGSDILTGVSNNTIMTHNINVSGASNGSFNTLNIHSENNSLFNLNGTGFVQTGVRCLVDNKGVGLAGTSSCFLASVDNNSNTNNPTGSMVNFMADVCRNNANGDLFSMANFSTGPTLINNNSGNITLMSNFRASGTENAGTGTVQFMSGLNLAERTNSGVKRPADSVEVLVVATQD